MALITASKRLGMLSTRFRQYAGDISRTHTSFMACSNILALVGCLSETFVFQNGPKILNRIQIWAVSRPVQDVDFLGLQELGDDFGTMAWSTILHKYTAFINSHMQFQLVFQ